MCLFCTNQLIPKWAIYIFYIQNQNILVSLKNCENFMRVSCLVSEKIEIKVFIIFSTSVELKTWQCLSVCMSEPKNFRAHRGRRRSSVFFLFDIFLKFWQNPRGYFLYFENFDFWGTFLCRLRDTKAEELKLSPVRYARCYSTYGWNFKLKYLKD